MLSSIGKEVKINKVCSSKNQIFAYVERQEGLSFPQTSQQQSENAFTPASRDSRVRQSELWNST